MEIITTGRKVTLKDSFKERTQKKLAKFAKFFGDDAVAKVTVTVEKNRQTVEVTVDDKAMVYRAEATEFDMEDALDRVCDVLVRQIHKNKSRLEKRLRSGAFVPAAEGISDDEPVPAVEEETEFRIIRSKKFAMKPLPTDEAILQMNMIGHQFYVFENAQTGDINVVYRRNDGDYGLIEPQR